MNIYNKYSSAVLRIFIGSVFVTSAILKCISLDIFDLFVSPKFSIHRKWETWVIIALSVVTLILFMIINAPNYLYAIVNKEKIELNVPLYESALSNSGKEKEFTDGKQLICMYSVGCGYCKRSAIKLHLILKNNHLSEDNVKAIFMGTPSDSLVHNFFMEQKVLPLEYTTFRMDTFLTITDGMRPVILFSDKGNIVHKASYITLHEKEVVDFLKPLPLVP